MTLRITRFNPQVRFLLLIVLFFSFGIVQRARGEGFDWREIPLPVLKSFQRAYPQAVIVGGGKEVHDSVSYYEITSRDGDFEREILYTAAGKVYQTEETVKVIALKSALQDSINRSLAGSFVEKVVKITRGRVIEYGVTVRNGTEKTLIVYNRQGNVIKRAPVIEEKETEEDSDDD